MARTPVLSVPNDAPGSPLGRARSRNAFSLVELLVVIGIIAVLISILLPTLSKTRRQAQTLQCQSNMRSIGQLMLVYANQNKGWLFPPMLGVNVPASERWMTKVFKFDKLPATPVADPEPYTPKIMLCPADATDVPVVPGGSPFVLPGQFNRHTYVISHNVGVRQVTYSRKELGGLNATEFIIMGEKTSSSPDHYMGTDPSMPSFYERVVDFARHGASVGSNYLHLDMHVESRKRQEAMLGIDPWRFRSTTSPEGLEQN